MNDVKENKMGTMPVNKLLLSMSLPMMVSMLVQALYNIVDSVFVAQISEDALTAVSMAFPMQTLMMASATGVGVGLNAMLSRSLGQKDYKLANKSAVNGIFLGLIAFLIFMVIGIFGVKPFYVAQTKDANAPITQYGMEYLQCVMIFSLGVYAQVLFERLLISTGKTIYSMFTQLIGAVTNIILDPILIFGLFGFPKMGVQGAAVATVIGQWLAAIFAIIFNITKNKELHLKFKGFRPEGSVIKTILAVGVPSMVMQAIGSVMTFGFNQILIAFSTTAVAVFGVYFKLNSIIFMPIFGLNNGMVPIIAYNYGAGNRKRMVKTVKYSVVYATLLMFLGIAILQIFPRELLLLFNADENMLRLGIPALRIICISFSFAGAAIVMSSVFQALGKGMFSMFVSLIRQLVVLLPTAFILSLVAKANGNDVSYIWWSFDVAEIASMVVSLLFFRKLYRDVIMKVPEGAE